MTRVSLGAGARARLAVVLRDMLGEPPEIAADVAASFDAYLARVPRLTALGLYALLWAIVWSPLVFVGRPLPVDLLAPETRRRYLLAWSRSRIYLVREGFFLVKAVALFGWGAHPVVRARLGLPGARA